MRMHADQVEVPDELVRRLLDSQFPHWRHLGLRRQPPMGTDHQLFRLGEDLLVRMPIYPASDGQAHTDAAWLPRLAPHLPVSVPVPVAVGLPDPTYPFSWSVVRGWRGRTRTRGTWTLKVSPGSLPWSWGRCSAWTRPGGR
jgi:aminoglycoside phosphotransferase (APT) family kinase protein